MRLPWQKKIMREDLKEAPKWIDPLIDVVNNFMESCYQALNRNITFSENIACFIKVVRVETPSTYPTMDDTVFQSSLKTKAIGLQVLQAYDVSNYTPAPGPVYAPWVEVNGEIRISAITGLEASKIYNITFLVI